MTGVFRTAPSRRRRRLCARARTRCLEIAAALALIGCSSDYTIGTIPRTDPPPLRTSTASDAMYATDGRSLYRLTVPTGTFTQPIAFRGCDLDVVEITLDDAGAMYGAGYENGQAALYRIEPTTGQCAVVREFRTDGRWSLGYVHQSLLGEEAGALVVFNAMNGTRTAVMPAMGTVREGCDIVLGYDGTAYVSALLDRTSPSPVNVIDAIDPTSTMLLRRFTLPLGTILEGLATADGSMYGFARDGRVLRVSFEDNDVRLEPLVTFDGPAHFTGAASIAIAAPR